MTTPARRRKAGGGSLQVVRGRPGEQLAPLLLTLNLCCLMTLSCVICAERNQQSRPPPYDGQLHAVYSAFYNLFLSE